MMIEDLDPIVRQRIAKRAGEAVRDLRGVLLAPGRRKADREATYRALVARVVEAVYGPAYSPDEEARIVEAILDPPAA
jgi:hypothetical protein